MLSLVAMAARAQGSPCRLPDLASDRVVWYVKGLASESAPERDSVGLTGVDTSQVHVVTDSAVCARVARAIDSAFAHSPSPAGTFVIVQAGSVYVANAPDAPDDPGTLLHFLGSNYAYKSVVVAF